MYPELPKGLILSSASTVKDLSHQPTALTVLPLREVPDGNQETIKVYVPFSISDLSMAEDKLGSFSEDPERFTKVFTRLVRSKDLTGKTYRFYYPIAAPQRKSRV